MPVNAEAASAHTATDTLRASPEASTMKQDTRKHVTVHMTLTHVGLFKLENSKLSSICCKLPRKKKCVCVFIPVNTPQNTIFGHGNTAEADHTQTVFQATLAGKGFPSQTSGFHLGGYAWSGRLFYELHLYLHTYASVCEGW